MDNVNTLLENLPEGSKVKAVEENVGCVIIHYEYNDVYYKKTFVKDVPTNPNILLG